MTRRCTSWGAAAAWVIKDSLHMPSWRLALRRLGLHATPLSAIAMARPLREGVCDASTRNAAAQRVTACEVGDTSVCLGASPFDNAHPAECDGFAPGANQHGMIMDLIFCLDVPPGDEASPVVSTRHAQNILGRANPHAPVLARRSERGDRAT